MATSLNSMMIVTLLNSKENHTLHQTLKTNLVIIHNDGLKEYERDHPNNKWMIGL
jgi:hypothetical protein